MKFKVISVLVVSLSIAYILGCNGSRKTEKTKKEKNTIRMATTTSTENSGLLAYLLPKFEKKTGTKVYIISAGTGKAIKYGENGDVDLILVHARKAEDDFVKSGFGVNRRDVMYNDFVIIGPEPDPAGIAKADNAEAAFRKIKESGSTFISRGDESGTHKKEKSLWKRAGIVPSGKWYISAGQGMGAVLVMANEKQAYTLSDRGTFIAYEDKTDLIVLYQGDKSLLNPYGIIAVNPARHKNIKYKKAMEFINWIVSDEGRDAIDSYRIKGKQLFYSYKNE